MMQKPILQVTKEAFVILGGALVLCLGWILASILGIHSFLGYSLMICFVIFVLLSVMLWRRWRFEQKGMHFTQDLQAQQESIAGRQLEIAILKEKMNAAVCALKKSALGGCYRGKAALYALPWFIIIGPSAAGKSTLLRHSGLSFPLDNDEEICVKGFGGTRHCDWWFSDQAILLDTAGRYTTEENDHEEWFAFLSLLKKYRKRKPINGVLICISLRDLLCGDERALQKHVKIIRQRVTELTQRLNFVFPLFLLITKCDLLYGFEAFFKNMSDIERQQVWGVSVENISVENKSSFEQQWSVLRTRLESQRLKRLAIEKDPVLKQEVYDFPDQFQCALAQIKRFVMMLCQRNPYQEHPRVLGVYLTSSEQEKSSKKTLIHYDENNIFRTHPVFKVASHPSQSYFVRDFFYNILFNTRHHLVTPHQVSVFKRFNLLWKSGLSLCIMGVVFLIFKAALAHHVQLFEEGVRRVNVLVQEVNEAQAIDQRLNALLEIYPFYQLLKQNHMVTPWYLKVGFYRRQVLLNSLERVIHRVMQHYFVLSLKKFLEERLEEYQTQWTTLKTDQLRRKYYPLFKTYLMLSNSVRFDLEESSFLSCLLSRYWSSALKHQIPARIQRWDEEELRGLVNLYLHSFSQLHQITQDRGLWHTNRKLITRVRSQLLLSTPAKNLFAGMRAHLETQFPPLSVQDLIGGEGAALFYSSATLPRLFTVSHFQTIGRPYIKRLVKQSRHGDWVIDENEHTVEGYNIQKTHDQKSYNTQKLRREMTYEYHLAYHQAWLVFLASISVKPFVSLEEAAQALPHLTDLNGPLSHLIRLVLTPSFVTREVENNDGYNLLHLNRLAHHPYHGLKEYFAALLSVQRDLEHLLSEPDVDRAVRDYAVQLLSGQGAHTALHHAFMTIQSLVTEIQDIETRTALKKLLISPIRAVWQTIANCAVLSIQQEWQKQIIPLYTQTIRHKFPFDKTDQEANINETINFFKPEGSLWRFIKSSLFPFLKLEQDRWEIQKWLNIGARFAPDFLMALNQAQQITQVLFKEDPQDVKLKFQVYPQPTPGLSQIILKIGHQTYHYLNGPQRWRTFIWSGGDLNQEMRLMGIGSTGANTTSLEYHSPWSLFRGLNAAEDISYSSAGVDQFRWTVSNALHHKRQVTFLIRSDYALDPFRVVHQQSFFLPSQLLHSQEEF